MLICGCCAAFCAWLVMRLVGLVVRELTGGASVIVSALAVVENFARGKEEHAEFEDKFTLLETRLVSCGKSIPVY